MTVAVILDGGNTQRQQQSSCGEEHYQGFHKSAAKRSHKAKGHADSLWPEIPVSAVSQEFQPH
jgi:hypothetical protein